MKVAVVIGHHEKAKGAFSEHLGKSEYDFYSDVVKSLTNVSIFTHDPNIRGYTNRIKNTAKKLNEQEFDLVMELHFNSAVPQAHGCETLYYFNSENGKHYAKLFSEVVNECTGIKLRNGGLKALVNKNDRGYASVYYPKAPTILIEPFFGSNKGDCEKIRSAENVASLINEFLEDL